MSLIMENLLSRISAYELLNNFIPGAVYIGIVERVTHFKLGAPNTYTALVLCYFSGVVICRIGSLYFGNSQHKRSSDDTNTINEPDSNGIPHSDFTKAEVLDKERKVTSLAATNNMYRTFIALPLCVLLTVLLDLVWCYIPESICIIVERKTTIVILACIGLALLFNKAYKKQSWYVANRAKTILAIENAEPKNDSCRKMTESFDSEEKKDE